jgi:hypothetical protein
LIADQLVNFSARQIRTPGETETLCACRSFVELRRTFRAAAVDVVEIQPRRAAIRNRFRLECMRLRQRQAIEAEVVIDQLCEVGVTGGAERRRALRRERVAVLEHGTAERFQFAEILLVRHRSGRREHPPVAASRAAVTRAH